MAFSLQSALETIISRERAAIVAGVLESICGAHKAGSRESFDVTFHVHFVLVVDVC